VNNVSGNELLRKVAREKMPDREQVRKNIKLIATQKQRPMRTYFRPAVAVATAAVMIACVLFINTLFSPQDVNVFVLRVYAMEQQADGSFELREFDLINQSGTWGAILDGTILYLNITLGFEGENIRSVEFSTEVGFFAKHNVDMERETEGGITLYTGDNAIILQGAGFERIGNSFTLTESEIADSALLFLGQENIDMEQRHLGLQDMVIRAIVTFIDGTTQEETISINLEGRQGVILSGDFSEYAASRNDWLNWLNNIPLEENNLVPESVQVLTDVCENGIVYEFLVSGALFPLVILENDLYFDEYGVFRGDMIIIYPEGYIAVARRGNDGVLTGMVYRIPEESMAVLRNR
jgi:hypothetical protein